MAHFDYPSLARKSIAYYLKNRSFLPLPPDLPPSLLRQKKGVFVSLHEADDDLRGCIGTFLPARENLAEEIIRNAVAAATEDPRFPPVHSDELSRLKINVDLLSPPKTIAQNLLPDAPLPPILDPHRFGLLVSDAFGRRGLLLPDLPTVDTPDQQLAICRQKAGISPLAPVDLAIFTVRRFGE